ncbi:MAG: TolC family protein, partial [Bacteroidota bacterium]
MTIQKIYLIVLCSCLGWGTITGQTNTEKTLLLEDAIDLAIQQNPQIKVQRVFTEIAANNLFKANAGLLPTISAVSDLSYSNNFSSFNIRTFQPEPPAIDIDESGVENVNISVGVQANYVLYDGGSAKFRYQLLQGQSALSLAQQEAQ